MNGPRIKTLRIAGSIAVFALCLFGLSRCGKVEIFWSEDVILQDGTALIVKRTAQGKKAGEIGGPGGWEATQMTLEIESPQAASNPPIWSERWVPMLVDYDKQSKEWYVVATYYMCTDWYDLGRPKLPYIEFRARGGRWVQVPLTPALYGRNANLLTGVRASGEQKRVTVEEKYYRDAPAAKEYKEILSFWQTAC